jgi:hypothetical protein
MCSVIERGPSRCQDAEWFVDESAMRTAGFGERACYPKWRSISELVSDNDLFSALNSGFSSRTADFGGWTDSDQVCQLTK